MLYVVGTPIGNIKDITLRALETLEEVDLILAEDTRQTVKLLNKYEIKTKLKSYHKHNEKKLNESIIEKLRAGENIALVSDAGMPLVSDPGYDLIKDCVEQDIDFTTVPSATAFVSALVLSAFDADYFTFLAFLPSKNKERKAKYEEIKNSKHTIIFYEAPHRIKKTLSELSKYLDEDRKVSVVREITKLHEEAIILPISQWASYLEKNELRGEMVVLIEGKVSESLSVDNELMNLIPLEKHLEYYIKKGYSKKEGIKLVAKDRGLSRNEVYKLFLD